MTIGDWVRRRGKWHLVESVVADAAITRCGRRMEPTASRGELEVAEHEVTRTGHPRDCRRCAG